MCAIRKMFLVKKKVFSYNRVSVKISQLSRGTSLVFEFVVQLIAISITGMYLRLVEVG